MRAAAALLLLAAPVLAAGPAPVRVVSLAGTLRLYRLEVEPWPVEVGAALPEAARFELEPGAALSLRDDQVLDFDFSGPARADLSLEGAGPDNPGVRVVRLDAGWLLVDGRFQFGRSEAVVLSLPDRVLSVPTGTRLFVHVQSGRSAFFLPSAAGPVPAEPAGEGWRPASAPVGAPAGAPPADLVALLDRPVRLLVVARDYDQDLGLWPHPAVLGPLLTERLAQVSGVSLVAGSGDTALAYQVNTALRTGDDATLRALGTARGARWVLVGNCVTDTPPQEGAPTYRRVRGQAEVHLLEVDGPGGGMELATEAAVTRVARAGRPMEQAARQAFEAASDEVARYLVPGVADLLQGRTHAQVLLRLRADHVDLKALEALRERLESLPSVRHVFRRAFARRTADFDLTLRGDPADFDRQWAALAPGPEGVWVSEPGDAPDLRVVRFVPSDAEKPRTTPTKGRPGA